MHSSKIQIGDSPALSRSGLIGRSPLPPSLVLAGSPEYQRVQDALAFRQRTRDGLMTFDRATYDAAGAFLIGQLERVDPTIYEPLVETEWQRDIIIRDDVTIGDEASSFFNMGYASNGGLVPNGIAWGSKEGNTIPGVTLDMGKTLNPLHLWNMELKWSLPELIAAQQLGKPIDLQQYMGMQMKFNMDVDQMVHVGDTVVNATGLCNSSAVSILTNASTVNNGNGATTLFAGKTPDQLLADINSLIVASWAATGYKVAPRELRLPPIQFANLTAAKVGTNGDNSVITFLAKNNLSTVKNGVPLNIQPSKWLVGRGTGATDRMMVYTRDKARVRYPMAQLQRTPVESRSIFQIVTYFTRLGVLEVPYPETIGYMDGV